MKIILIIIGQLIVNCLGFPNTNKTDSNPTVKSIDNRVINGYEAKLGQFPWHAIIHVRLFDDSIHSCSGSIISNYWILTEAGCMRNGVLFRVVMGTVKFSEQSYFIETKRVVIHPLYYDPNGGEPNILYNIALLELPQPIPSNNRNIKIIQLPALSQEHRTFENWLATVSGFGSKYSTPYERLQWTNIRVLTIGECKPYFSIANSIVCGVGNDNQFQSPCIGDGGSALVANNNEELIQIGLYAIEHRDGCDVGRPSGFINIAKFIRWIGSVTGIYLRP